MGLYLRYRTEPPISTQVYNDGLPVFVQHGNGLDLEGLRLLNFLYYRASSHRWHIGTAVGHSSSYMYVQSSFESPGKIPGKSVWAEGGGFVAAPELQVFCILQDCTVLNVSGARYQPEINGIYVHNITQKVLNNGRPAYTQRLIHAAHPPFILYYKRNFPMATTTESTFAVWMIGPQKNGIGAHAYVKATPLPFSFTAVMLAKSEQLETKRSKRGTYIWHEARNFGPNEHVHATCCMAPFCDQDGNILTHSVASSNKPCKQFRLLVLVSLSMLLLHQYFVGEHVGWGCI